MMVHLMSRKDIELATIERVKKTRNVANAWPKDFLFSCYFYFLPPRRQFSSRPLRVVLEVVLLDVFK
jgi:hypothetical protein